MSRLLNALLDISKLESGAMKPDITISVAALFEELRGEFAKPRPQQGAAVHRRSVGRQRAFGPLARRPDAAQPRRQRDQVHGTGSVWLCVPSRLRCGAHRSAGQRRRHPARISCNLIYDEFYQVGVSANTSRDGYGLGLSIVHRLVKLLGLRIDVQSEVGVGSTFSLSLPAGASVSLSNRRRPCVARWPHVPACSNTCCSWKTTRRAERHRSIPQGRRLSRDGRRLARGGHPARVGSGDIDIIVSDYHLGGDDTGTDVIASVRKVLKRTTAAVLVTGDTSSAVREAGATRSCGSPASRSTPTKCSR